MKLDHLLESYKYLGINASIVKRVEENKSGVIKYNDLIYGTYYMFEQSVVSLQIFAQIGNINNILELIKIICHSIDTLSTCNVSDRNKIVESLGLYDKSFVKGKHIIHNGVRYQVEIKDGLFLFGIGNVTED